MRSHPAAESLAALVHGTLEPDRARRLERHLVSCPECHATYAEAVELALRAQDREPPALDGESHRAALDVVRPTKPRSRFFPPSTWAVAAAALIVASGAGLATWRGLNPPARAPQGVLALIAESSARGMVLPGGEPWADWRPPVYRGGAPSTPADPYPPPEDAVKNLAAGGSVDRALETLSAYVAMGQLGIARDLLGTARRYSDDSGFDILDAVIAYREGDTRHTEAVLSSLVEREPQNALARFDLALLLAEEQRASEAIAHLRRVVRDSGSPPLTRRANSMLEQLRR